MAESLFTTQTPANTNATDGSQYTLGTVIRAAVAGQVTHGRWRFPDTLPSGAVEFVLYDNDLRTELARATFSSPVAGAWNTVVLPSPVSLSAGQYVVAAVDTPDRYVATSGFFASSGLTNGNLSAPATGADPEGIGNGRFIVLEDAYPANAGSCYFVDVVFEPSVGGQSVAPGGVSAPVAVGDPLALVALTAVPDGLAAPVAVGSPVASWSASVSPAGLFVPVQVATFIDPTAIGVMRPAARSAATARSASRARPTMIAGG